MKRQSNPLIEVLHLKKNYSIYKRNPGFLPSLLSLVHRRYEIVRAVDDISFTLNEGELVGFIGPNGAGKTTTLKCLTGLLHPNDGQIKILGFTPYDRNHRFLSQISLVMGQKNQLWWDLPASESFLLNKEIYGIPDNQYHKILSDLVELLDAESLLNIQVRKLSLGERMKMELIAALIHSPKILFLDEPTIGLDVVMQKKIRDFIREYNSNMHSTILLTSHYMEDVRQLAKRVIIINSGKLIYDGKLDNLVKRYAPHKLLTVILDSYVIPDKLSEIGFLAEYTYPKAVIQVPRNISNSAAAQILENFPVHDLNIEEPDIEDIIRDVFAHHGDIAK